MNTYEVAISNTGGESPFVLSCTRHMAPDPYTACLRALANFLKEEDKFGINATTIRNFRKDHLVVSKIAKVSEEEVIFERK